MDTCEYFTETNIKHLLTRSFNVFCEVDPIPTWLIKELLDVLISLITDIVNKSLSVGVFQRSMKPSLVKPLIKNTVLTEIFYNNYRPVIVYLRFHWLLFF